MMLLSLFFACSGATVGDTSGDADACGDPDGAGTDTGDLPNVLGNWTSSFAVYDDGCTADNLGDGTETWIGAFELDGSAPNALYASFLTTESERLWGVMDRNGGFSMSGTHTHPAGTLYVQFGGLVYHDQYQDRDIIDGSGFLGLDSDADGKIDCGVKGSWKAIKSGL